MQADAGDGGGGGSSAAGEEGAGGKKKPRRRGSRGGRKRTAKKTGAAGGQEAASTSAPAKDVTSTPASSPVAAPRGRGAVRRRPPTGIRKLPATKAVPQVADVPPEVSARATAPAEHAPFAAERTRLPSAFTPGPALDQQSPSREVQQQPIARGPAVEAPPEQPAAQPQEQGTRDREAQEQVTQEASPSGDASNGANAPAGGGTVPPRVGMRPALIQRGGNRMSFSKGQGRQVFRPGGAGGFRPPRPFVAGETPGVAPVEGAGGSAPADVPQGQSPQVQPPQQVQAPQAGAWDPSSTTPPPLPAQGVQAPQGATPPMRAPQHPHHRGPGAHLPPGQRAPMQQGGGRGQGGGRQPQGGPQRGPQQHRGGGQMRSGPMPQQPNMQRQLPQAPMMNPQNLAPQQPLPSQPSVVTQKAVSQVPPAFPQVRPMQPSGPGYRGPQVIARPPEEFHALPPTPGSALNGPGQESISAETAMANQAADNAALAPFAEDIEIEETLTAPPKMREMTGRDMIINVVEGEEVRIAIVRRGVLEELYMERSSTESHIGNIYKGRVTNVEPSIQAAFIDFGIGKNGFLHISDLHPQYFPKNKQPRVIQPRQDRRPAPQHPVPQPQPPAPQAPDVHATAVVDAGVEPAALQENPPVPQPQAVGENGGQPVQTENAGGISSEISSGMLAHNVAVESPEQTLEMSPSEVSTPAVSDVVPQGEQQVNGELAAENGTENGVGAEASQVVGETAAVQAAATPVMTEASGEAAPAAEVAEDEEAADFGSAYNNELGDDEDEMGDFEGGDDRHMKPMEKVGRKTPRHERPPIQQCLRRGQEVLVQVIKEGIGTKGPTLTSYVSCPGRYLVMMPGMAQLGVSRKIEDLEQRRELKRTLMELNPPKNLGFIIRTAGTEVAKKELQGDLAYLVRMWKVIANRIRTQKAPVELYEESDLVIRTIRDVFNESIDRIIVDNEQVASRIRDFLSIVDPRSAGMVELYTGTMPLFQKFGVEREIERINSRRVEMPNGGSLVIDSTEALVAIDVNSGRYRDQKDAELTAFNVNKEAVKEVVRQLRLRDLGGVIVIDFIDMREERHKREIEHLLRVALEEDRAKTKVLRMSQFCLIELTRQRVRPSLKRSIYMDCPHCRGSALIKTPESVALDVMRRLAAGATRLDVARLEVKAYPAVATFMLNRKRKALVELEEKTGKRINVNAETHLGGDQVQIEAFGVNGNMINIPL